MKPGLNTPEDDNDAHDFRKILGNTDIYPSQCFRSHFLIFFITNVDRQVLHGHESEKLLCHLQLASLL